MVYRSVKTISFSNNKSPLSWLRHTLRKYLLKFQEIWKPVQHFNRDSRLSYYVTRFVSLQIQKSFVLNYVNRSCKIIYMYKVYIGYYLKVPMSSKCPPSFRVHYYQPISSSKNKDHWCWPSNWLLEPSRSYLRLLLGKTLPCFYPFLRYAGWNH